MIRRILDFCHYAREWIVQRLVHMCMLLYGTELSYTHVCNGAYDSTVHVDRNLDEAKDVDTLLSVAKGCWANAVERRKGVTDKCKTLLTISALLLGLCGFLLPEAFVLEALWMRVLFYCAGLMLLVTVVLLVEYFGVRAEMSIAFDQDEVSLQSKDLKKNLVNLYLRCQVDADNTTNFLVDVYKTARFFFLTAVSVIAILFTFSYFTKSATSVAEEVVRELRRDPALINLLQGPKGDKGDPGAQGSQGPQGQAGMNGKDGQDGNDAVVNVDKIIDKLLQDERFCKMVEQAKRSGQASQ